MSIKLMFCTNRPDVAAVAEKAGVDRLWVDMEYLGKAARQGGMDTLQSHHTPADVASIRAVLSRAELVVRINPMHDARPGLPGTEEEIEASVAAGADLIMLPYFHTVDEVRRCVEMVAGRARVFPLLETPAAAEAVDELIRIPGVDEILIGINDLALGYGKRFLFEVLTDGTVERLCAHLEVRGIPYGFGGFGYPGRGTVPAQYLIAEHYRLGSTRAILSRSFCRIDEHTDLETVRRTFREGITAVRACEQICQRAREAHDTSFFSEQQALLHRAVQETLTRLRAADSASEAEARQAAGMGVPL